jgi:hypothetical protein
MNKMLKPSSALIFTDQVICYFSEIPKNFFELGGKAIGQSDDR